MQNYTVPNIYQDISNQSQGYFAFRFACQQCGWAVQSRPIRSSVSTVTNVMDIGVGMLGGFWGRAAEAGEHIYGSKWHQEQVDALQKSWAEVQPQFHYCPKCFRTVCARCFNLTLNLCTQDAPDLKADGASFQHEKNIESQHQQIAEQYQAPQFNVRAIPSAVTPDLVTPPFQPQQLQYPPQNPQQMGAAAIPAPASAFPNLNYPQAVMCPTCRRMGPPGKFCQDCGTKLPLPDLFCPKCATPLENNPHFCPECGTRIQQAP